MQVIDNTSIANSHGVYFPDFYSPFAGMVMEDTLLCLCREFVQTFVESDIIYLQVTTVGTPRIEINSVVYNSYANSGDVYNFAISIAAFVGQKIRLNLIVPPISGADVNVFSAPIFVAEEEDFCHVLLEWRSECESMGIDYTIDPDFIQRMRVPIRFIRPSTSDNSTYNATKNSSGVWEFCTSDLDEVWSFAIREIPDWMHQVIRKAFNNSYFAVNGTEFFTQSNFRMTERRCCLYQGEAQIIPKDSDNAVNNCCVNDFEDFVHPPTAMVACDTPATPPNISLDTRGSTDSDLVIITSASSISYVYNFGSRYYVEIDAGSDPTVNGSWTYIGGSGTEAEFQSVIVANIVIPVGGFAGYFEIDCAGFDSINVRNMSVTVAINDNGTVGNNAVCVLSCVGTEEGCPVASLALSSQVNINNINISNDGTVDNIGTPVHNDPDYNYIHTYTPGACGGGPAFPLFKVSGVGGSGSLSFSEWHASLSGGAQTAIMAEFTGGMGGSGYSFDKEAVSLIAFEDGLSVGGEWCLTSTVIYTLGSCSDTAQMTIIEDYKLYQYAHNFQGFSPTLVGSTRTGIGGYSTELGFFGYLDAGPHLVGTVYYIEGDEVARQAIGTQTTLESTAAYISALYNYTTTDVVYHALAMANNSGLESYADAYFLWDSPDSAYLRINKTATAIGRTTSYGGGILIRNIFDAGGTALPISVDTISSVTHTVHRFAVGGGGLTVSGTDDPGAGTGSPQTANIVGGGTAHSYTVIGGTSNMQIVVNSLVEGTYYVKYRVITTDGLPLELICSFTIVET